MLFWVSKCSDRCCLLSVQVVELSWSAKWPFSNQSIQHLHELADFPMNKEIPAKKEGVPSGYYLPTELPHSACNKWTLREGLINLEASPQSFT